MQTSLTGSLNEALKEDWETSNNSTPQNDEPHGFFNPKNQKPPSAVSRPPVKSHRSDLGDWRRKGTEKEDRNPTAKTPWRRASQVDDDDDRKPRSNTKTSNDEKSWKTDGKPWNSPGRSKRQDMPAWMDDDDEKAASSDFKIPENLEKDFNKEKKPKEKKEKSPSPKPEQVTEYVPKDSKKEEAKPKVEEKPAKVEDIFKSVPQEQPKPPAAPKKSNDFMFSMMNKMVDMFDDMGDLDDQKGNKLNPNVASIFGLSSETENWSKFF